MAARQTKSTLEAVKPEPDAEAPKAEAPPAQRIPATVLFSDVSLTGNVTRDPEVRFLKDGTTVTGFGIAVQGRFQLANGTWVDRPPTFVDVSVFGRMAENVIESLHKGDQVVVSGDFRSRQYVGKDGAKGTALEMKASSVGMGLQWATAAMTKVEKGASASLSAAIEEPF